jgi:hypothetical protein
MSLTKLRVYFERNLGEMINFYPYLWWAHGGDSCCGGVVVVEHPHPLFTFQTGEIVAKLHF